MSPAYINLIGLQLVAGSIPQPLDSGGRAVYDHQRKNGLCLLVDTPAEAIGKVIHKDDNHTCLVVGVVKDFTQNSLQDPIQPLFMCLITPEQASQWVVRAKPGQLQTVYSQVQAIWTRLYPSWPVNCYFQDEVGSIAIRLNVIITSIFSGFALISIFMAATGMFALVSLTVLKRLREIAIRKVVGAGSRHILWLVGAGYGRIRADSLLTSFTGILPLSGTIIVTRVAYLSRVRTTDVLKSE